MDEAKAEVAGKDEPDDSDEGEDADRAMDMEAQTALRDTKYHLQVTLQEPARGLVVRRLTLIFDENTVYGQRAGSHEAWIVTSTVGVHSLKNKPAMKRLIVDKIPMLARADSRLGC